MEQDQDVAEAVRATLRNAGHHVERVDDATAVRAMLQHGSADLLILDTNSYARVAAPRTLPILLLGARSAEDALVAGLDAGARDYLVKPVRHGELALRVQVLLRRAYPDRYAGEALRFGCFTFDTASARITRYDTTLDVTQKEFELALLLFQHLGRPLSRAFIREKIWPSDADLPSRTLDTHVSRVRSKLDLRPESGFRLSPVYSFGYQLEQLSQ